MAMSTFKPPQTLLRCRSESQESAPRVTGFISQHLGSLGGLPAKLMTTMTGWVVAMVGLMYHY